MNIIDDEIQDILENNNHAQAQFENLLNSTPKKRMKLL